jgi:RNA polymerase sigma-70 factor (ECF subfamily)
MEATQPQAQAWTFERLYTDHYAHVLTCVRSLGCSQEEAEDITQETFIKALQALSTVDTTRPTFPWLYQIAKNTAYDLLRRKHRARGKGAVEMPEDAEYSVSDSTDVEEAVATREGIQCALQAISPRFQEALFLWRSGYRYQEIAGRQGWTLANTRAIVNRARRAFKQHYEEVSV